MAFKQSSVRCGLGSHIVIVPADGTYTVAGQITLPNIASGTEQSELIVTINLNGSPEYVGQESAEGFHTKLNCEEGDEIEIEFASSADVDQDPNAIKATIQVYDGI